MARTSFKVWYFKALAECALFKLNECEKSCLEASIFAGDQYQTNIEELLNFIDQLEPSKESLRPSLCKTSQSALIGLKTIF